jgi:hypothetical protein
MNQSELLAAQDKEIRAELEKERMAKRGQASAGCDSPPPIVPPPNGAA